MTNEEMNAKLDGLALQADKIAGETKANLATIIELQGEIVAGKVVSQVTVDKLNALAAKMQAADDLNPDAPPPVSPPADPATPPA